MVIAQGKHSQALEVLPVKVLGRFVDIFLTVPRSKWSKCGNTQQTFCSVYSSAISITKTGLSELHSPSLGIQTLLYSYYIFSGLHQCDTVPCTELLISGALFCCLLKMLRVIPAAPHNLAAGAAHTRRGPGSSVKDYASLRGRGSPEPAARGCPKSLAASPVSTGFTSPHTVTCMDCVG